MAQNDYDAVLSALKLADLLAVSRELKVIDVSTADDDLRTYLRSVIGLLEWPVMRYMNFSMVLDKSPSVQSLVDYCRRCGHRGN